jgi:putative endonuclease
MTETSDVSIKRFYIYILFSLRDKGFYIGYTNDLKRRLTEHSHKKVESTKNRVPLKLIHYEYFINREDAQAREKFLKSGYGRKQMRDIVKRTLKDL